MFLLVQTLLFQRFNLKTQIGLLVLWLPIWGTIWRNQSAPRPVREHGWSRAALREQTQAFLQCQARGQTAAAVPAVLSKGGMRGPAWGWGWGSCEFHRDCPRRTSICLLVPCLFFFPRGIVLRGPTAMLSGRGLCGAANCPGDIMKLFPDRSSQLCFSSLISCHLVSFGI